MIQHHCKFMLVTRIHLISEGFGLGCLASFQLAFYVWGKQQLHSQQVWSLHTCSLWYAYIEVSNTVFTVLSYCR